MDGSTKPQFLTLKEFVQLSRLSEATLRRRVRDGSLPAVQMGGKGKKLLFPASALEQLGQHLAPYQPAGEVESANTIPSTGTPTQAPSGPRPRWAQKLVRRPGTSQDDQRSCPSKQNTNT